MNNWVYIYLKKMIVKRITFELKSVTKVPNHCGLQYK